MQGGYKGRHVGAMSPSQICPSPNEIFVESDWTWEWTFSDYMLVYVKKGIFEHSDWQFFLVTPLPFGDPCPSLLPSKSGVARTTPADMTLSRKWHLDQFSDFLRSLRLWHIDRHTDHTTCNICSNKPYIWTARKRCSLIIILIATSPQSNLRRACRKGPICYKTAPFPSTITTPSNAPIPRPTPLTTPNSIQIHLAILPQYTFRTDRHTVGLGLRTGL